MTELTAKRHDDLSPQVASHGCGADADHDREVPEIDLLSSLTIRGVTLRNRIVMSPMCQYSAEEAWPATGTWFISAAGRSAVWRW